MLMNTPITINGVDGLRSRVGDEIGVSDWVMVSQREIDEFARLTGDDQWIHVDPVRAARSRWGGTIAHGLYTLSLGARFSYDMFKVEGFAYSLNYGLGKVRFPAPLLVGSNVRMRAVLSEVTGVSGGVQTIMTQTFEVLGAVKPVCVAEKISRHYDA